MVSRKRFPVSFTADPEVYEYFQKLPDGQKSFWVNNCCKKDLSDSKDPLKVIKSLRKEQKSYAKKISKITDKIENIKEKFKVDEEAFENADELSGLELLREELLS